jgi:hypothetical protein
MASLKYKLSWSCETKRTNLLKKFLKSKLGFKIAIGYIYKNINAIELSACL